MPETLLSASNILLFGRELADVVVRHEEECPPPPQNDKPVPERKIHGPFVERRGGATRILDEQLEDPRSRLARIYGFSFEGYYYDLARPAIFLVHGDGASVEDLKSPPPPPPRASRAPAEADRTGAAAQDYSFPEDMRVWSYDKGDFSIRLDIQTGSFEDILLGAECSGLGGAYSGMDARMRSSGMDARIRSSGMDARIRTSGMDARGRNRGD